MCRDELSNEKWEEVLADCFDRMYEMAEKMGGLVSGEHGIGYAKKVTWKSNMVQSRLKLWRGSSVFDSKNILNPGKICF